VKHTGQAPALGGTPSLHGSKVGLHRTAAATGGARPNTELPDFRAISRDALAASGLAALEHAGSPAVLARPDDGPAALLSVSSEQTGTDRHDRPAAAAGTSTEHGREASELSASGPSSGQLMAAAHIIAGYLLAGSAAILDAAAEALAPRGSNSLSIRIAYVTPEGGHAAVGLQHPDLGELGIEVSLNARALSVIATAESERSAAAIREGQGALANRLAAQGMSLQSLTVVVVSRRPNDRHSRTKRQEG
jgi:Flagellar hook-length control protein FliK